MSDVIKVAELAGDFAEDKDLAAEIREEHLRSAIENNREVVLDFAGVTLVTQSFIHALIADVLRKSGEGALRHMVFKSCTDTVRGIIETVVQYSLESIED